MTAVVLGALMLSAAMLSVVMLSVVMLSVIMLSVVMLSAVGPCWRNGTHSTENVEKKSAKSGFCLFLKDYAKQG